MSNNTASPKPLQKSRTVQSIAFGCVLLFLTLFLKRFDLPDYLAWIKYPETLEFVSGVSILVFARLLNLKLDDNKKVASLVNELIESKKENKIITNKEAKK